VISKKQIFLVSVASLLLIASMAVSGQAQPPPAGWHPNPNATPLPTPAPRATPDYAPMWAVNGKLRWKKEMGVVPVSSSVQSSIENRCISFYVAISDPRTGQPIVGEHVQVFAADDEGDYHVCRYTLKIPPNRQVRVFAGLGGEGLLPEPDPNPLFTKRAWVGGDPAKQKLPPGAVRFFNGSKYATLDRRSPRATVDFELVYAFPRSNDPR
jgi:hypothetical protein